MIHNPQRTTRARNIQISKYLGRFKLQTEQNDVHGALDQLTELTLLEYIVHIHVTMKTNLHVLTWSATCFEHDLIGRRILHKVTRYRPAGVQTSNQAARVSSFLDAS